MAKSKFPAPSIPVLTERFRQLGEASKSSDATVSARAVCFEKGALWALETVGYSREMVAALQTQTKQADFSFLMDEDSTPPDEMDVSENIDEASEAAQERADAAPQEAPQTRGRRRNG